MNRSNPPHIVAEAASADPRSVGVVMLSPPSPPASATTSNSPSPASRRLGTHLVAGAAAALASPQGLNVPVVIQALAATALSRDSPSIANQWLERRIDLRMRRTANRPLPAGRVSSVEAIVLCVATLIAGVAWLGLQVN